MRVVCARWFEQPALGFILTSDERVPHISLVFREIWDTMTAGLKFLAPQEVAERDPRIPHLAKNERDMGHPFVGGQDRIQQRWVLEFRNLG